MSKNIDKDGLIAYLNLSSKIADYESLLYGSEKELERNELKINDLVSRQNRIRFAEDQRDLFREQIESVLMILVELHQNINFDVNLYFDLVYNLMILVYDRVVSLEKEQPSIASMLKDIGIDDYIKQKIKALLNHTCGGGCG
ncbi:hypothetical protein PITCH_A420028 [uncultured Desulfobacterium sp.]|uniref:Uncharacterized protein n=1 Tax=uncultured Desulfobacterium sp. TaxID=201089 RepID=A0A445N019_9BACT|nr:hypothetical protein PITCH_A420028 [uncultured Desulfobacterium sp.]